MYVASGLICVCCVLKAYVCRCVDSCVVCAQACESQRLITDAFLRFSPSYFLGQGISLNPQQIEFTCLSNWGIICLCFLGLQAHHHTDPTFILLVLKIHTHTPVLTFEGHSVYHGVIFLAHVRTLDTWWHPTDLIRVEPSLCELAERVTDTKGNTLKHLKELGL